MEFDAWLQGHTGRPLIDLVAALTAKLDSDGSWDRVKTAAMQVAWRLAGALTKGIAAPNEDDNASVFDEWLDIDNGVSEFKDSLRARVVELDGKLVVFVDELDRCEPTYALDLLNKARHLFDVIGVVIVFGVNRAELGHAVQAQYGPDCDVDGYLRRFVDLSIQLRQPTTEEWAAYLEQSCSALADCAASLQEDDTVVRYLLTRLAENCGGRLRDVEQILRHTNLIRPLPTHKHPWPIWVLSMLMLRYLDRDCYDRFVAGAADVWEVARTMRESLPFHGESDSAMAITLLDTYILTLPDGTDIPSDEFDFVAKYTDAVSPSEEHALLVYESLKAKLKFAPIIDHLELETIHKAIEIAASN